jgi:hypothetical protein
LKQLGFEFHRQAAGSHEIWLNPATNRYTTIPNHPGDMPEGTASHPQAGQCRHGNIFAEEVRAKMSSRSRTSIKTPITGLNGHQIDEPVIST